MREILFRGKLKTNGEWSFGNLNVSLKGAVIITPDETPIGKYGQVIPETVGQYTGLNDSKGIKIFEGDIVDMPKYGGGRHQTVVYFKNGKFAVDGSNYHFKDICPKNMEVVGNIHDNPELLKEAEQE